MRHAIITLAFLVSGAATGNAAAAEKPAPLPDWMAGAWQQESGDEAWADEYWTRPRGGLMLGAARIGQGDTLGIFEHTRIVRKEDGTLSFYAQPSGAPAAEFPMVTRGTAMIEFANPAHDYPQRIRYWRDGDRLKARISLMDGSKAHEWDYGPLGGG